MNEIAISKSHIPFQTPPSKNAATTRFANLKPDTFEIKKDKNCDFVPDGENKGFIGKTLNCFKNITGIGASSSKIKKPEETLPETNLDIHTGYTKTPSTPPIQPQNNSYIPSSWLNSNKVCKSVEPIKISPETGLPENVRLFTPPPNRLLIIQIGRHLPNTLKQKYQPCFKKCQKAKFKA